jgi:hypothetical protein
MAGRSLVSIRVREWLGAKYFQLKPHSSLISIAGSVHTVIQIRDR